MMTMGKIPFVILGVCGVFSIAPLCAQPDRIASPVDVSHSVILEGARNHWVHLDNDQGPLPLTERIQGISLGFKKSSEQQAALERLLEEQRDPSSPNFRKWLTPEQYADRFGLSRADFAKIKRWLESQGFQIGYEARARNWIVFSGTVAQVNATFHTEMHRYFADGKTHYANATAPSVPAAIAPLLLSIAGLDDFHLPHQPPVPKILPHITNDDGSHSLVPGDLAVIYDINPIYQQGITGSGQSIAIVGQSNIELSDIEFFRSQNGLPPNDPQVILVPGYPDPGITDSEGEADLDLEYSGGIAYNAQILYYYGPDAIIAIQYAVDQSQAPVMSASFGFCAAEASSNGTSAQQLQSWAQQANTQGMTWLNSAGDSGPAGCDPHQSVPWGESGIATDLPAEVPEITAVGGTEFNDGTGGSYWNSTNSSTGVSANGYIPEMAWNDCQFEHDLVAGGGGVSQVFTKPAWQAGPGVPDDGFRDVPDVALTASWDHDFYDVWSGGNFLPTGGTSAASPTFAGIIALLNDYLVNKGTISTAGLGNINPTLYSMAQSTTDVFHDVTVGDIIVPCEPGSPDCPSSNYYGYPATPGYDLATGWGSVDVANLFKEWGGPATTVPTMTSAVANPMNVSASASTTINALVTATTGSAQPTGSVSFSVGGNALGTANLSSTGSATLTVYASQLAVGSNTINVTYSGATGFAASSATTFVTVTIPTVNSAIVPSVSPNPVYQQPPDANGNRWFFTIKLSEIAGVATTVTSFSIDGTDFSSDIDGLFGSNQIPAKGTLSADLAVNVSSVPDTLVFQFGGADPSGHTWTQQISVQFLGAQLTASMKLTSSPNSEIQNPAGDPNCGADYPFYQELNLQELNGREVYLTKFLAGGNDFSDQIDDWFGSWRLAPLGALQAYICWKIDDAPTTLDYEIDGVDESGNNISATLTVPFQGAGHSAGALSASPTGLELKADPSQTVTSTVSVDVPSGQQWTLSVFPANQNTSWLVVHAMSGTGPAQVNLTASAGSMPNGAYTAMLVFQSVNTIPQFFDVPVLLIIGASSDLTIGGVANGASFLQTAAPGMVLDVFGQNLADSQAAASAVPLPASLSGASATVDGIPAPLYYASPGQLNIQIPYEAAAGDAILAVDHGGKIATYWFEIQGAAPGIFVDGHGNLVPAASAAAGSVVTLFLTGTGDVQPEVDTGAAPASSIAVNKLPKPRLPVSVQVGGEQAQTSFVGIPYGLVGVTQINFTVPADLPSGPTRVTVTVGSTVSAAANLTIQ